MTDRDELELVIEEALDQAFDRFVSKVVAEVALLRPAPIVAARDEPLVGSRALAAYLNVNAGWVRANAVRLRGRRLAKSTWRWSLAEVDEVLLQAAVDGESERG